MIKIVEKDIFSSNAEIIAHQVNTEGAMGAGLAKEIKRRFPEVYEKYNKATKMFPKEELLGKIQIISIPNSNQKVANLFAESLNRFLDDDMRRTDYDALRMCLRKLNNSKTSIAIPYKLGCGLGGGDWDVVYEIIEDELKDCEVEICRKKEKD